MQVSGINKSYISNNFSALAIQNTYLKNQPYKIPEDNATWKIDQLNKNLIMLINILKKKVSDFQAIGNIIETQDMDLENLKNLIRKLGALRENLNSDNVGETLSEIQYLGNDNYEILQQLLRLQELHGNKKSVSIRSYMFLLYEKAYANKDQSSRIDVYF